MWPSPGPVSPSTLWGKGKGKGLEDPPPYRKGKGNKSVDTLQHHGKGKGNKDSVLDTSDEQDVDEPVPPRAPARRGKNLAALARQEVNAEELDFSKPWPKEQENVISSSDTSTPAEVVVKSEPPSPAHNHPAHSHTLASCGITTVPAGEEALRQLQHSEAQKIRDIVELEASKAIADQDLSSRVTKALDLSLGNQVRLKPTAPFLIALTATHLASATHFESDYTLVSGK